MTDQQSDDLAAVRAIARHVSEPPRMPSVPLKLRVKTSPHVRGLIPTSLAVALSEKRAAASWEHDGHERERALAAMRTLLADTPRAGELNELARAHVIESRVRETLFWQRWRVPSMDVSSRARMQEALGAGRGVIVSPCHHGPFFQQNGAICACGATVWSVTGPWWFEDPTPDVWGRRVARWQIGLRKRTQYHIPTEGAYDSLLTLLKHRQVVSLYFDMPGSRPTSFFGKRVSLASGTSRLASESDALVVPVRPRRARHRMWVDVLPPLDPRDFSDREELHDALAATHERLLLENPAAVEDPNREGSWGAQPAAQAV